VLGLCCISRDRNTCNEESTSWRRTLGPPGLECDLAKLEEIKVRPILSTLTAAALAASSLVSLAQAAPVADQTPVRHAASNLIGVEKTQFFFGGQNYCWYDTGWQGSGWYWCGYAWRSGLGWGGGRGWHGWHGGGGGHMGHMGAGHMGMGHMGAGHMGHMGHPHH
jgi:hypothetical protein